ncbi:MAG: HEPN domain-containing protein, partial [Thermoanaerobaculum sp.]
MALREGEDEFDSSRRASRMLPRSASSNPGGNSGPTRKWKDWYEQGERDRDRALPDIQYGYSKWACFALQQSAEKVVKAM